MLSEAIPLEVFLGLASRLEAPPVLLPLPLVLLRFGLLVNDDAAARREDATIRPQGALARRQVRYLSGG